MLFKCNLLLIVLYTLLLISKPGVVDAGSKLSKEISTQGHLTTSIKPPIQPFVPNNIQNLQSPRKDNWNAKKSLGDFTLNEAIADVKNFYLPKKSPKKNSISEQYSKAPKTFTELYGEKIRLLGSGYSGEIYLTEKGHKLNPFQKERFAVKILMWKPVGKTKEQHEKMIFNEFRIAYGLNHENVVQTYDLLLNDAGYWCLVMEYLDGYPLDQVYTNSGQSENQNVRNMLKQLIHGVSYLHSMGIAHRDIKPENLLLTPDNVVKIIDFGLSTRVEGRKELPSRVVLNGTKQYLAPEAFPSIFDALAFILTNELSHEYNVFAADVFSLGVTAYYLLTGYYPWEAAEESDIEFVKYKKDPKKWFEEKETRPDDPIKVPDVIRRMLDPNPETRIKIKEVLEEEWVKRS